MTSAPVVGITRNPFFKKHFLECDVFKIAQNVNKYLGYFSKKICCQELSNNRPIRSHCAPTKFPSLKKYSIKISRLKGSSTLESLFTTDQYDVESADDVNNVIHAISVIDGCAERKKDDCSPASFIPIILRNAKRPQRPSEIDIKYHMKSLGIEKLQRFVFSKSF